MKVHVSYKAGKTPDVEREFQHQLQKLERRLQVFKPDLVSFHAIVEQENHRSASTSLNLRLPSGQMAAQKSGENALAAVCDRPPPRIDWLASSSVAVSWIAARVVP